jgi:protein-tyrosine phosphatase
MDQQPTTSVGSTGERQPEHQFNVVVICRANHCRSPLMEFLLRQQAQLRNLNWSVSSAGTEALDGIPMHPYSAALLAARGMDTEGWVSRSLDASVLADAHLVLTATQEQRLAVEAMEPYLTGATFPLLQFAYLAQMARSPRLLSAAELGPWLLKESYRRRKRLANFPEERRDLEDPMGRPEARFRVCARLIVEAYADILASGPAIRWG